jgi:hypothetical protein
MRRRAPLLALVLALSVVTEARSQPVQGEAAQRLVGTWRYVGTWIDGKPRPNRGANPKGYIFYAASGEMAAQIAPDRVNPMAGATPTAEEAKAALADYVAYFGTWSLDEHGDAPSPGQRAAGAAHRLRADLRVQGQPADPAAGRHHAGSGVGADEMTNSSLRGVRKHAEAISAKPACASEARLLRFARNDAEEG